MKYALNLGKDGRILSATFEEYNPNGAIVETLPEGEITDYKYINGQYIYDPLPKPAEPEPQPTVEERLADCELVLAEIMGGAL